MFVSCKNTFSKFDEETKLWREELDRRSIEEHSKLKIGELYWAPDIGSSYKIVVYLGRVENPRFRPKNAKLLYDSRIVEFWPGELVEVTEQNAKNGGPFIKQQEERY